MYVGVEARLKTADQFKNETSGIKQVIIYKKNSLFWSVTQRFRSETMPHHDGRLLAVDLASSR